MRERIHRKVQCGSPEVYRLEDELRWHYIQDVLRFQNIFQIDVGVNKPRNLKEFTQRSAKYMEYEDEELAARAVEKAPIKKKVQSEDTRPKKDLGKSSA